MHDLRVTIKDKPALSAITREQMEAYAEKFGWSLKETVFLEDERAIGSRYGKYSVTMNREYNIVAIDEDTMAYSARMSENLMNIEQCENKSQLQAYCDITGESIVLYPTVLKEEGND